MKSERLVRQHANSLSDKKTIDNKLEMLYTLKVEKTKQKHPLLALGDEKSLG